jgi:hypothetical protein
MSFLESKNGLPDFSKAVISLWFRVPQESIDSCTQQAANAQKLAEGGDYSGVNALMNGVIPLVTFGVKGERRIAMSSGEVVIGHVTSHTMVLTDDNAAWREEPAGWWTDPTTTGSPFVTPIQSPGLPTTGPPIAMNPSCIGIDCSVSPPTLYFLFETGVLPEEMSGDSIATAAEAPDSWTYCWPWLSYPPALASIPHYDAALVTKDPTFEQSTFTVPGGGVTQATSFADVSWAYHYATVSYSGFSDIVVTADKWHHVLVSVDVSEGCSVVDGVVAATSKMWVALDDENYGSSDILASGALAFVGMTHPPGELGDPYTYTTSVEISGGGVGVPSSSDLSGSIYKVQMAELQIFTGVTLDTSIEKNRRAFINSKGQPVDEAYGVAKYRGIYGPKSPNVPPSAPAKLLGKKPDVAIVRSARNWMSGFDFRQTKFRPNGKIRPVKPDPVLGK